jgi:hypothetical protein
MPSPVFKLLALDCKILLLSAKLITYVRVFCKIDHKYTGLQADIKEKENPIVNEITIGFDIE